MKTIMAFIYRWCGVLVVAVVLVPVTAWRPYDNGPPIRSDGVGYHAWTRAILSGDLNFAWFPADDRVTAGIYLADNERDHWANKYAPGVAIARLPFMASWVDQSVPGSVSTAEHHVALILGGLALLVALACIVDCCRRLGATNRNTHVATLALTFGTGLFHYATYDASFSHVYSALAVSLLVWLAVRAARAGTGRLPVVATSLVVAWFILLRNTNGLIVVLGGGAFQIWVARSMASPRRPLLSNVLAIGAGLIIGVVTQLAINSHAHGRLTLSSYASESFVWDRPMLGSVLVSYERGLLVYYPILAIVVGLGLWDRRTRWWTVLFATIVLAYATLYGYWHSWMLGAGFGHRGFVELVPAAIPLLAISLESLAAQSRRWVQAALAVSVLVTMILMAGYWCGRVPLEGVTAELYWSRIYRIDALAEMWTYSGKAI